MSLVAYASSDDDSLDAESEPTNLAEAATVASVAKSDGGKLGRILHMHRLSVRSCSVYVLKFLLQMALKQKKSMEQPQVQAYYQVSSMLLLLLL